MNRKIWISILVSAVLLAVVLAVVLIPIICDTLTPKVPGNQIVQEPTQETEPTEKAVFTAQVLEASYTRGAGEDGVAKVNVVKVIDLAVKADNGFTTQFTFNP